MEHRPNILLINVDQWPIDLFEGPLAEQVQLPTLRRLQQLGTTFSRAYTECPVCVPARRTLHTGMTPRNHGINQYELGHRLPDVPTLAQCFSKAGYQTQAVGKLHLHPMRTRAGFDDVLLHEEGRSSGANLDDYELFLGDRGLPGQAFAHALSNNEYSTRCWHLAEDLHPTCWTARSMVRQIRRRDPDRPAFWYLSFCHPHPPLAPLREYWDMYEGVEFADPHEGNWTDADDCPPIIAAFREKFAEITPAMRQRALRAFTALCTQIDAELRLVLAAIREEGQLDNTAICFLSDHGDMIGHHGLWSKFLFYEPAARIPLVLVPPQAEAESRNTKDDRLAALQDVMPSLLDLGGIKIPDTVDGSSLIQSSSRGFLLGEHGPVQSAHASRMLRTPNHKLIYYPVGNRFQLFDISADPAETRDLSRDPDSSEIFQSLCDTLAGQLSKTEQEAWLSDGNFIGNQATIPDVFSSPPLNLGLQRSIHWPPPA